MNLLKELAVTEKRVRVESLLSSFSERDLKIFKIYENSITKAELSVDNDRFLKDLGFNVPDIKKLREIKKAKELVTKYKNEPLSINNLSVSPTTVEEVARKYYLKCLRVEYYTGELPENLNMKITEFMLANGFSKDDLEDKLYILAPVKNFHLESYQRVNVDPILLYLSNDNKFHVVHSWGKNFPIWRRIIPYIPVTNIPLFLLLFIILLFSILLFSVMEYSVPITIATSLLSIASIAGIIMVYNDISTVTAKTSNRPFSQTVNDKLPII